MNSTPSKSQVVLKGMTIELLNTIFVYTSFYLLLSWDCHSLTMRNRFLWYGQLSFFIGIWFIHFCYCCIYKFIPTNTKKKYINYGFLVILFLGIINLPENYGIKFILGFSIFSLPCTTLIRNISDRIYTKVEQFEYLSIVLMWKYIYLFWIINCICLYYISFSNNPFAFSEIHTPPPKFLISVIIYWWILGISTLLITLYHLYSNHWKNGILISLLMIFWGLFTCNFN